MTVYGEQEGQYILQSWKTFYKNKGNFPILLHKASQNKGQYLEMCICLQVKVKVKVTLVQALRLCTGRTAYRGSRGIALSFHDHGTRRGEGSAALPGRTLPPGKIRYPLYRRLGGPQGQSEQVRKISSPTGFDPRTVQPVASRYTGWATGLTVCT